MMYDTDVSSPVYLAMMYDTDVSSPVYLAMMYDTDVSSPVYLAMMYDTDEWTEACIHGWVQLQKIISITKFFLFQLQLQS